MKKPLVGDPSTPLPQSTYESSKGHPINVNYFMKVSIASGTSTESFSLLMSRGFILILTTMHVENQLNYGVTIFMNHLACILLYLWIIYHLDVLIEPSYTTMRNYCLLSL